MNGLLRAEFRKVSSTRLWWGLLVPVAVLSMLINLFGGLFTASLASVHEGTGVPPLLLGSLAYALTLTTVFAAVHGIVAAAGEFRHRTATTTYLTAPGRGPVLIAKMLVAGAVGALYAAVAVLVGVLGGLLSGAGFPDVGALLATTLVGVLVAALWGMLGVALGTVLSNQVTVLVVTLVYVLIGEALLSALLNASATPVVARFTPYLPVNAGDVAVYDIPARVLAGPEATRIIETLAGVTAPPPWWGALLVLTAWTAAAAATAWVIGSRRDIT